MKSARDNVFLIGPMGSGKTTVGRLLAKALKLEFIDSDHAIEQRTGADIPWIFDIEGEEDSAAASGPRSMSSPAGGVSCWRPAGAR